LRKQLSIRPSEGVSFNKFIAKVASDMNKPDGITVITPDMSDEFIDKLPIRKFFGVGKVTEEKMLNLGIKTGADLKKYKKVFINWLTEFNTSSFQDKARFLTLENIPLLSLNLLAFHRPTYWSIYLIQQRF